MISANFEHGPGTRAQGFCEVGVVVSGRTSSFITTNGIGTTMFPLPSIAPDGSGTSQFRENWLPFFCRAGREVVDVGEFVHEIDGWLPRLEVVPLPASKGQDAF